MTTTIETSTTRIMHFSVSGDFLTQQARDFVEEGDWRKGYSFLMDSLHGMDAQIALDILQGKKKLVGVDDIELEDDTEEETVKEWLDFQFRNCFVFKKKVYRAYGYVSANDKNDMKVATEIANGNDPRSAQWKAAEQQLGIGAFPRSDKMIEWAGWLYRNAYYARNIDTDICLHMNLPNKGQQPVLCEEVELDIPLWYEVSKNAVEIIAKDSDDLVDLYAEVNGDASFDAYEHTKNVIAQAAAAQAQPEPKQTATDVAAEIQEEEAQAKKEAERYEATIRILQEQITVETNNDTEFGWKEFSHHDEATGRNVSIRVPLRAFICAALSRAHAWHLMPEYRARCPQGLKMYGDDRYHTDAWLGAGLNLELAYDQENLEQQLFMSELYALQREKLSFEFDILARGEKSYVSGEVIHDPKLADKEKILVLTQASPEFADAAVKCAGVIVETGSKLAHLAIVSREEGIPVVRVAGAVEKFKPGKTVYISFEQGKVELMGF